MGVFDQRLIPKRSLKGLIIDKMLKGMVLNTISYMDGMVTEIVERKNKDGWVNPEMKIVYDIFSDIIALDEPMRKRGDDHIRDMYTGLRNIMCVTLDEDSHYLARFFLFCELIHDKYPELRAAMEKSKVVMEWEAQHKWALEQLQRRKNGLPIDYEPLSAIKARGARSKTPEEIEQIRASKPS